MKLGIIKERKNPPDRRVVLSPKKCKELLLKYPQLEIKVERSDIRIFPDESYINEGIEVTTNMSNCDVLLGVKEVPISNLIPNKKYFFFSHTTKKQVYNRDLLSSILSKNIELYDYEEITAKNGKRLVAFGRYAGIVGAYNGFRAYGLKYNTFNLPKAETLHNQQMLINELKNLKLPNIKVVLTGKGRVSNGAKEMLDAMQMREVTVTEFLTKTFTEPVYVKIHVLDYIKRKDGKDICKKDFYKNPNKYESNFMRFSKVADMYIAGHFFADGSPYIFTRANAKSKNFTIKVVADISCDIDGPVASTIRASTIANPIYGYHPQKEKEVDFREKNAIAVMAVDNLPCELPKDASEGFGNKFSEFVIPAFFNKDIDGILNRACITKNGKLTTHFSYLQSYVDGK